MNANNIFSLVVRATSAVEHPLIKRSNLGFALHQPFAWSLINTAAVLAQLPQHGQRNEHGNLIILDDADHAKRDQLKVKLASLRHFNRQVGDNDIGMAVIKACLRPDEKDVSLEEIKRIAQDRIKIERRSGKLMPTAVKARYVQLSTGMYEKACAKKRRLAALLDEVFFIVNRSDEEMAFAPVGDAESGAAHKHMVTTEYSTTFLYRDEELVDMDAYAYLLDGLLDKCVQPVIRAREELQRVLDRSYRTATCANGEALMAELERLGTELGINWKKIADENARIDAELLAADAELATDEADLDAVFAEADVEFVTPIGSDSVGVITKANRTTIKSPERIAREQEEHRVAKEKDEHNAAMAQRAAKAAATRAKNKASSLADLGALVSQS